MVLLDFETESKTVLKIATVEHSGKKTPTKKKKYKLLNLFIKYMCSVEDMNLVSLLKYLDHVDLRYPRIDSIIYFRQRIFFFILL